MSEEVIESVTKIKKKQQKAKDFIGWKSEDGKLEVVGIAAKQGRTTTFKVTCTECSKDKELFPEGYFVSTKGIWLEDKSHVVVHLILNGKIGNI